MIKQRRNDQRWVPAEEEELKKLAAGGATADQIAAALGRTHGAVKNRAQLLRATVTGPRTRGPQANNPMPTMLQRSALQKMLDGGWKPATALQPTNENVLLKMVEKGWLEHRKERGRSAFRLSDAGRKAFRARLP